MRLIFMGTPEFAVPSLRKLVEAGHKIIAVFTQPDRPVGRKQVVTPPPVKVFAAEQGLAIHQPSKIKTDEARRQFEPLFKEADAGVVAAYGRILPEWMLNAGLDTGPVLLRTATAIGDEETAAELTPRLAEIGADSLIEALSKLERGEIEPEPQNDAEATLAPILKREDGEVDWAMTAAEIFNRLRGFTPFPGCYTFFNGHRLEIVKARVEPGGGADKFEPGAVCEAAKDSFVVACGGATRLRITEVQPEGKRAMPARDFLNGARLQVGAKLGGRIEF